jgi:hypothetical protein
MFLKIIIAKEICVQRKKPFSQVKVKLNTRKMI